MLEKMGITRMAQALAAHAGARLGVIAGNVAQADTPGYRARDLPAFAETYRTGGDLRATRPGHIGAPAARGLPAPVIATAASDPNGNSVSLEGEMVKAAAARQDHAMALAIYRSSSDLVRTALGRGR
jgi:flagellar basal-body rod protein FlgB